MIGEPSIYWPEQCQFCLRALNTSHCDRNQAFMRKLDSMNREYLGTVEFKCDYFSVDKQKLDEQRQHDAQNPSI
jgi:hypothetical protein